MSRPIFFELAARAKAKLDDTWFWCSMEALDGGDTLMKLSQVAVVTKGPKKGKRKFIGEKKTVSVSNAEIVEQEKLYELKTGLCHRCDGGKRVVGASADGTTKTKDCVTCGGTGKASTWPVVSA